MPVYIKTFLSGFCLGFRDKIGLYQSKCSYLELKEGTFELIPSISY